MLSYLPVQAHATLIGPSDTAAVSAGIVGTAADAQRVQGPTITIVNRVNPTLEEAIAAYYNERAQEDNGTYVVFRTENMNLEGRILYTVRFQRIYTAEEERLIERGQMLPSANVLCNYVCLDKNTGEVYQEDVSGVKGEILFLWDGAETALSTVPSSAETRPSKEEVCAALRVPSTAKVTIEYGTSYYWSAAQIDVLPVQVLENGESVAGSDFYYNAAEKCWEAVRSTHVYESSTAAEQPSDWAKIEVEMAREAGLIPEGLDALYQQHTTRAEFCRFSAQLLESKTQVKLAEIVQSMKKRGLPVGNSFSDTQDETIVAMSDLGVVNGNGDGTFLPDATISRQEAAVMLTRLSKIMGSPLQKISNTYGDFRDIASWAYYGVSYIGQCTDSVSGKAVMSGTSQERFSPQETYTREQTVASFNRLFGYLPACSPDTLRIDPPRDTAKLQYSALNGGISKVIQGETLPVVYAKLPSGSTKPVIFGILVNDEGKRLGQGEYELSVRPVGDTTGTAEIDKGLEVTANGELQAILTVQSPVLGEVWQEFALIVGTNSYRLMVDSSVPVQTMDTVYGKQAFNFGTCGMYVENYHTTISGDMAHVTMTVYNTNCMDGAVDVYDANGNYLSSERVDKRNLLPDGPVEAIVNTFMLGYNIGNGDALTYRQTGQSSETEVELDVPKGGTLCFSVNYAESPGVFSYNLAGLIADGTSAVEDLAKMGISDVEFSDSFAQAFQAQLEELYKSGVWDKVMEPALQTALQNTTTDGLGKGGQDLLQQSIVILKNVHVDWDQIRADMTSSLSDIGIGIAESFANKLFGPAGAVMDGMFTISHAAELLPQITQLCSSGKCDSAYMMIHSW